MQEEAIVHHLTLTPAPSEQAEAIVVGSPAWFAWLHSATRFRLATPQGLITVRKERSGGGRGSWYWRAYRKQRGRLHRFYLGPDTALTPKALAAASAALGTLLTEVSEEQTPPRATVPDSEPANSEGNDAPLIIRTKITPPTLRLGLVMRPALIAQLRMAIAHPLTLVVAPAGFGKTTLLIQSLIRRAQAVVAWLTLERSDDTPNDFLVALHAALTRITPDRVKQTDVLLRLPYRVEPAHVLDQLLTDLASSSETVDIVLDDYHVLEDQAVHALVARFIEYAPAAVHVVIASRTEPPLPLARLRARGLLAEVREPELRFGETDAAKLLRAASGVALIDSEAATLVARTEGWVAGLHLAALALRTTADPARMIAAFSGNHRLIADYLLDEVLLELPEYLRQFLLATSILDRLSAPLCAAVWSNDGRAARAEAQQLLEELERRGLFLTPLDDTRTWYRYHPLFAELVRAELVRSEEPTAVAALHRRAAEWFIAQIHVEGQPALEAAIVHLLASGASGYAAELVEQAGLQAVFRGEMDRFQRWVNALPVAVVQARPFLHLAASGHFPRLKDPWRVAEELATFEDMPKTRSSTDVMGGAQPEVRRAETLAVRAYVAQACGDLEGAASLLLDALALLPDTEQALRWRLLVSLGNAYALEGWLEAAHLVLTASISQAGDDPVLAYLSQSYRAWVDLSMGRVRQAHLTFRQLYAQAEAAGWSELPITGDALLGMGAAQAERGQLTEGLDQIERGLALMRRMGFNALLIPGELERARIYRTIGRVSDAHAAVAQAEAMAREFAAPFLRARITAARLDLGLVPPGEYPSISPLIPYSDVPVRLAVARAAIREGRAHQAHEVLKPLLHVAQRRRWGWALLSAHVLWALACSVEQDAEGMMWALGEAVAQSEPEGVLLPFLEGGQAIISVLQRAAALEQPEQRSRRNPIARSLDALVAARSQYSQWGESVTMVRDTPEPLTPREREVLVLMMTGASNAEIAAQLVVAVSTVKAHSSSIFGKLGVANRTQAAARAYHLGILEPPNHGQRGSHGAPTIVE
jgi:LuxR family maltose regulon positive regulatory protein